MLIVGIMRARRKNECETKITINEFTMASKNEEILTSIQ